MTVSCAGVLAWRPEELEPAADQLRRRLAGLLAQVDRVRAAHRSSVGHWHGHAAAEARLRLAADVATGDDLGAVMDQVRRRLDGVAESLAIASTRVRTLVEGARADGFTITDDGTVHPPYLPPPGFAAPPPDGLADYVAGYDARADRLLAEATARTEELGLALREAGLADEHQALGLRFLDLPAPLTVRALELEPATASLWRDSADEVPFPRGWEPWPALSAGSATAWSALVVGAGFRCFPGGPSSGGRDPDERGTGYYGGGFVTGPDGHRYPLVVPQVRRDGVLHRTNADVGDPLVRDLMGLDRGWHEVGRASGVDRFGDKMSTGERWLIGLAGVSGLAPGPGTGLVRRNDLLPRLGVDSLGTPSLSRAGAALPTAPGLGPEEMRALPADPPGMRTARTETTSAVLALVTNAAGAAAMVKHLDDHLTHGYALTLEQNEDGRRRALLDLYDIFDDSDGGLVVQRHLGYLDQDGSLRLAEADPLFTAPVAGPGPGR